MLEKNFRKSVVRLLRPLHAVSIENGVGVGTPDVNCALGWVELKCADVPADPDARVGVPHFTREQRAWLRKRASVGGSCWVLLKVGKWWLVLGATVACELLDKVPLGRLIDECEDGWPRTPRSEELIECLRSTCLEPKS